MKSRPGEEKIDVALWVEYLPSFGEGEHVDTERGVMSDMWRGSFMMGDRRMTTS